ncbi:phage tail protein, partial [Escherichia coli]
MSASPVVKTGEEAKYHLIQKNISKVGLGEAAKRNVGTGANQIPDMGSFMLSASVPGYQKLPSGLII